MPTVRIERFADQGRCVAHLDGRVVFVRFALPGELVEVSIDQPARAKASFWTAEVTQVLEASPYRVQPLWPEAGPLAQGGGIGGADLIHASRAGQLEWKRAIIAEHLQRLAQVPVAQDEADPHYVRIALPEEPEQDGGLHWRTRLELLADEQGRASMSRRQSNVRVPIDTMPLASHSLLAVANAHDVWQGHAPGSRLRIDVPEPASVAGDLLSAIGENYAISVQGNLVAGSPVLRETVVVGAHRFEYEVAAAGFWQMHRRAPALLAQYVLDQVQRALAQHEGQAGQGSQSPLIWELYSGAGLFTLPLASLPCAAPRLLTVEYSPQAVQCATRNIERAGLRNVRECCGDVYKVLQHPPRGYEHPSVVVLDPPRAGAKAAVMRTIAAAGPHTIVYVSCNSASLARDVGTLRALGYTLTSVQAFDIYPMTHHVETVCVLEQGK